MSIYTADLSDPIAQMLRAYQPTKEELFENTEPNEGNIPRGEAHPSWGHRWSMDEEGKNKIRLSKIGELNPAYGKPSSKKQKEAMSKAMKGITKSEKQKEKMRQAKLGITKSSSHKEAMAEAHRQRLAEKVHCPHCNKYCSKHHWATQKFHFDNCKYKVI